MSNLFEKISFYILPSFTGGNIVGKGAGHLAVGVVSV
jgi:hypothetical protein